MTLSLINNISLLLALCVCHSLMIQYWKPDTKAYQFNTGILLGLISIIGMMNPFVLKEGFIFDGRSIIAGLAGLTGGIVSATLVTVIGGVYRIWGVGGGGSFVGICVLASSGALGCLYRFLHHDSPHKFRLINLYCLGMVIHINMLLWMFLLPSQYVWITLNNITLPVLLLFPVATMIIGRMFYNQITSLKIHTAIKERENHLSAVLHSIGDAVISCDANGNVLTLNEVAEQLTGWSSSDACGKPIESIYQITNQQNGETIPPLVHQVIQEGKSQERLHNVILTGKDEKRFQITERCTPLMDQKKRPTGCVLVCCDKTLEMIQKEELQKEQDRFITITNTARDAIVMMDGRGNISFWNFAAERIFGYRSSEIMGKNLHVLIAPERFQSEHKKAFEIIKKTGEGSAIGNTIELYAVRKDRTEIPVELSLSSIYIENQWHAIGIIREISERKKAEKQLRDERQRLSNILWGTNVGTWEWNIQTGETWFNERWAEMIGYSLDELQPTTVETWKTFLHPDDLQSCTDLLQRHFDGELDFYESEIRMRHKNGDWVWVLDRGRVIHYTPDEEPLMMYGTHQDITLRKQAQLKAEELLTRLQKIASKVPGVIYQYQLWTDGRAAFPYASDGIRDVFGVAPEDVIHDATPVDNAVHPNDFEEVKAKILMSFETLTIWYDQFRAVLPDGRVIWLEGEAEPELMPDNSVLWHGYISDVTERKQAEKDKQEVEEQLNQLQKMESIGRLAGGVAHDFNNVLMAILGYTQMAIDKIDQHHSLYNDLTEVKSAAERAAGITRQLLAFARKQTVVLKVIDLNDTIAGMLKMLNRLIGENIELAWLPGKNLAPIHFDPSQVDQILANLCVNARDAIKDVGKITIETKNVRIDEEYCDQNAHFVPGEYVVLIVSDNGCGMSEETVANIFEPFFTTKELGKGTGLGMSTVYGIVKQNSGFINVYSEVDHGTTFRIYFPQYHVEGTVQRKTEEEHIPAAQNGACVFIVEDEPSILEVTKKMLRRIGYHVLSASTPGEALQVFESSQNEIQLLITDVVMPEMNGHELAEKLMKFNPTLKCLYMSGYTADVISHHNNLEEGIHFIQKPFTLEELANKVSELLRT